MSLPPPAHPDTTWTSNTFKTPSPRQFPRPTYPSPPSHISAPGPSIYQAENFPSYDGSAYPPVDWFPQPRVDPATGISLTTSATLSLTLHDYYRRPGTEDDKLDVWLEASEVSQLGRKTFQCTWPECITVPFTGICQAYTHVRKHLGIKKLYGCVACDTQFATRGAAKRHVESQQMSFVCTICHKVIKRKDYWRKHERMCASKLRVH